MFLPLGSACICSRGLVEAAMGINLASGAIKASSRVQLRASINVNLKSVRPTAASFNRVPFINSGKAHFYDGLESQT